jgi:hypothetical protein
MRTSSWLRRNKAARSTTAYNTAVSIGVIFCIEDETLLPQFDSFIHKLQQDNKKVTVLAYFPQKITFYTYKYDCFTPQNISFWGNFNTDEVNSFVKKPFDYLFHLDDKPSTVVNGILAQSKAKCRIGKYAESNDPYYELMINTEKKDYLNEMYNYTSILN